MSYKFRDMEIPQHMLDALNRYIDHGLRPGSFLQAVISNDLHDACRRADDENIKILPAYVAYLYNERQPECWGSNKIMEEWINKRSKDNE